MINATRVLVSTFGALAGVAGLEHGVGEILQGNVAPAGLMIESWPNSELFRVVAGEPAMTILPSLLLSGILTVVLSLLFLLWVVRWVEQRNAGLVLVLLSIGMLLVGGGIFPPVMGLLAGLLATQIHAPRTGWRAGLAQKLQSASATVWPWSFAACVLAWLALFPGSIVLGHLIGPENANAQVPTLLLVAFGFLFLTALTGLARDSR